MHPDTWIGANSATTSSSAKRLTIHNVREQIIGVDAEAPLLDGSSRPYVNFDNAASTPALRPVFDAVSDFMTWYSSVHRGAGFKSQLSTHAYEQAHELVCDFVRADAGTHVVLFGKNSTEALNKLSRRLPLSPDDVVLTTEMEHHSNDLPWRAAARVAHVRVDREGALDQEHLDHLLRLHRGHVRLVAVAGASNVTGCINPVHQIAEKAHAAGAQIVVDAAQLAPHRALDMGQLADPDGIDYLVLSAHKMYAPYGTGALIGRRDTFLHGDPDLVGGGTVDIVTLDDVLWTSLPDREEGGSPNVVGAVALGRAVQCLQEMGMEAVAYHEAALTAYLLRKLAGVPRVCVFGDNEPGHAALRVGVVPFVVEGMSHHLVAAILSAEGGIGVRNGCFCAHPYLMRLLEVPAEQAALHRQHMRQGSKADLPGMVRVSFGCYNNEAEVDWFIEVLERIVHGTYQGDYRQDPVSGEYWPQGYAVRWSDYFTI